MRGVRVLRVAPAMLVVAALLLSGCSHPYRVRVDAAVLTRDLEWKEEFRPDPSGNSYETDYRFEDGAGPPYPAILQVFSIRDSGRQSTVALLELAKSTVDNATVREGIEPDRSGEQEGTRTLRNGLETRFFTREGTVTSPGPLFEQNVRVRIVGEVAYDGRSSTSVVVVGIAQVAVKQCTPILNTCQFQNVDLRSWIGMVGDTHGSVRGAQSPNGLIDHLVTHD